MSTKTNKKAYRQITLAKTKDKNTKASVPRIYTSRPWCIICEVDTEFLSTRSWPLPMNFF